MKIGFSIAFLIFICNISYSQSELDSLFAVWENSSLADTTRAIAFKHYIREGFFNTDADSAIALTQQLYQFCQKANYTKGMVSALSTMGYAYFRTGNYPKALEAYQNGLSLAEKTNDRIGAAYILLKAGYIYHDNGDLIRGLANYQRSLKIFQEEGDMDGVGSVYNEFGNIYSAQGKSEKALDYFQKSVDINLKLGTENEVSAMYLNMGSVYLGERDYPKALEYFQKGLALYEEDNDKLGIASGLGGIGDLYLDKGEYDKASDYLQRSLMITEEIDDVRGSIANLLGLADIYAYQENHLKAIKACKKSLDLAESLGDLDDQMGSCECLYEAYKTMGDGNEALVFHEKMLLLSDSLKTEETAMKIQSMEFANIRMADSLYQVEKDLKVEMSHQKEVKEKENNRNIAIGAGIFFLVLAGGFYSRWRYVKRSKAIIEKEKDRSENLLLNILPAEIAEELKEKGKADARDFELVSILFSDFVDFTQASAKLSAKELIAEINHCFKAFDGICVKYNVEKIKTIGDAYMAAGGLPLPSDESVVNTVLAALEMQSFITERKAQKLAKNEIPFEMRVGIHTGPVVAGIVGVKKFQYDIWGDTVNIASRMESNGAIEKVNISQGTYDLIKEDPRFVFDARGKIRAKGKGEIEMYFVSYNQ